MSGWFRPGLTAGICGELPSLTFNEVPAQSVALRPGILHRPVGYSSGVNHGAPTSAARASAAFRTITHAMRACAEEPADTRLSVLKVELLAAAQRASRSEDQGAHPRTHRRPRRGLSLEGSIWFPAMKMSEQSIEAPETITPFSKDGLKDGYVRLLPQVRE
jgi:hypothetical protein